jgi:hypothetical protein
MDVSIPLHHSDFWGTLKKRVGGLHIWSRRAGGKKIYYSCRESNYKSSIIHPLLQSQYELHYLLTFCSILHAFHFSLLQTHYKKFSPYFSVCGLRVRLTLILLTWRIWWASTNASRLQMEFNSVFKVLMDQVSKPYVLCKFNLQGLKFQSQLSFTRSINLHSYGIWNCTGVHKYLPLYLMGLLKINIEEFLKLCL